MLRPSRPKVQQPLGGAVLRPKITSGIQRAALLELARKGYAHMSMDSIARRAAVGKAAIYRRWANKQELVVDLLHRIGLEVVTVQDNGSLAADVRCYIDQSIKLLSGRLARAIMPELYAEMARNTALGAAIRETVQSPKRIRALEIIDRAIVRGEIPRSVDREIALDLLAGPLYWRLVVTQGTVDEAFSQRLTMMLIGALRVWDTARPQR